MKDTIDIIVACDFYTGAIGFQNKIPWYIPNDMKFFKKTTTHAALGKRNMVVMGRHTWESIGCKPLVERLNVVVTRKIQTKPHDGVIYVSSLDAALHIANFEKSISRVFVIGGAQLYKEALHHKLCSNVIVTYVHNPKPVAADTFFPLHTLRQKFELKSSSQLLFDETSNLHYSIMRYNKK